MENYIGTKLVMAEPETIDGYDGYTVVEADGHKSWSPKEVFEEAYHRCDACNFGLAIEAMRKGKKVALPKWSEENAYISIQSPDEHSKMTAEYFYVTNRFGLAPWIPTMIEMLSEEWRILLI